VCSKRFSERAEPVFVNLLRSPAIDSQPGGPVRQPYLTYRNARLQSLAKSIPRNRFLGSLNVYKYVLCVRGLITRFPEWSGCVGNTFGQGVDDDSVQFTEGDTATAVFEYIYGIC
jgi:hypothetical protein